MNKPTIITVANHKGGVGKTTLSVNLSSGLLKYFDKVLIIDFDPQANTTYWICKEHGSISTTVSELLRYYALNDVKNSPDYMAKFNQMLKEATIDYISGDKQMSLITSSLKLSEVKIELTARMNSFFKIKDMIKHITPFYDIVIIDTPPSIELLTHSAIAASDFVLIPVIADAQAISGALDIVNNLLPAVREYYNPFTKLLGVVFNQNSRTNVARVTKKKVNELFSDSVFKTVISHSVRIGELTLLRDTINNTAPTSKSAKEYTALTDEVYQRITGAKNE